METSLVCIDCGKAHEPSRVWQCECGGLLEARTSGIDISTGELDRRLGKRSFPFNSGVWIYKELVNPLIDDKMIVSKTEGNTTIYSHRKTSEFSGVAKLYLKHEGENPTGSFKDRGMTVGVSEAVRLGCRMVGCASTGNTSASLAAYASTAGIRSVVFIPSGEIAYGKLSQTMAYGAKVVQVKGNFDDAMRLIQEICAKREIYLLNSINPWRIEGQKAIAFELLQQMHWNPPDWIALPAGNLGNTSAIGKALRELKGLGLVEKMPRIAAIQAEGADPFYRMWKGGDAGLRRIERPSTLASAIRIGNPVSWKKAIRAIKECSGVVERVSDQEIMNAKAVIDSSGIGCEPASAASLAGVRKLRMGGVIKEDETVVCILTGNILKDPDATINYHRGALSGVVASYANAPVQADADSESIMKIL